MARLTKASEMVLFAEMYGAINVEFHVRSGIITMDFENVISASEFVRTRTVNESFMTVIEFPTTQCSLSFSAPVSINLYPAVGVNWVTEN